MLRLPRKTGAPCWRRALARVRAELALYGALECLSDAGEHPLSAGASIFVSSRHGPISAPREIYDQARDGLPMPLLFLQAQPGQVLAVLAAHLGWSGNGSFTYNPQRQALLRLAAAQCGAGGGLIGWVDEAGQGASAWLRLRPVLVEPSHSRTARIEDIFSTGEYLHVMHDGMEVLTG